MSDGDQNRIHELPSVEVALDHLDWAIRLLVEYDALIPAYSLAAIAEEQIGKRIQGSALDQMKKEYGSEDFNALRNFLKHGTLKGKPIDMVEVRGMKQEVALMILRASENLRIYDNSACSEILRFGDWMRRELPGLTGNLQGVNVEDSRSSESSLGPALGL